MAYRDFLREALEKFPPLATKVYPTPSTVNNSSPRPISSIDILRKNIGAATLTFLANSPKFNRCINLLLGSQNLIDQFKGKVFIISSMLRSRSEYSYMVAPAGKALEGTLLAIALHKGMITQTELDRGISIGEIYHDNNGRLAKAKGFVLKAKNKGLVEKIYADWGRYRNKILHYDEDFFVNTPKEATRCVEEIYETIKLAYQIFIGDPTQTPSPVGSVIRIAKLV